MLSPEQLVERKKGIGASEAGKIVSGDWFSLWELKTGRREDDDLSDVFAVQLGIVTEELNLNWYRRRVGNDPCRRGEAVVSKEYPFLRCTLDGFDEVEKRVIQAKHVNGFTKIADCRAKYVPQVTHEMICTNSRQAVLSVIIGTSDPALELVDYDEFFANDYIEKAREFWGYVERNEPPPQGAPIAEPPPPAVMRVVSMEGKNAWASAANDWLDHNRAAKLFKASEIDLKAMVEPDVREAAGHGIIISRNKAGSLSIKEKKS